MLSDDLLTLPARPADKSNAPVAAWRQPVVMETYLPEPPDRYPAYLDNRVYQGSSGKVYPLPFHDRISQIRRPHSWDAIHIENTWLRVMVLPELGGRIHLAYDKRNGYDIFYRNPVIKPALVGLAGPWIAGGVEFNWPQHHRPATFLPTAATIEHEPDGSITVWCSDHDPFARMKGMHGIRLRPDRVTIELRVRLYNRSDEQQTFLWWANVAARTHADYQSFFPGDVQVVADHAKRAVSTFPAATGRYYGVDYPARRDLDRHPGSDRPVPGDRLDWYRNIPVPTSYMCLGSTGDFFGGYDHRAEAGFVHWADHHYAVGKKQWTWGNAAFGHAWDRNLADDDASYIELMAGVYTDNQPDFSFIAPGETKVFSQFWYPISKTGPVQEATADAAVSVQLSTTADHDLADITLNVTRALPGAELELRSGTGESLWHQVVDLDPESVFGQQVRLPAGAARQPLELTMTHDRRRILQWATQPVAAVEELPPPAAEPPAPAAVGSVEQLYLTGVHLDQYRHATRSPEPYWMEALNRDPGHVGSHTALARRRYRQARFDAAERHLRAAIDRLTMLNPNPADGEPYFLLGLTLTRLGRDDEAYDAFAKATWNRAWRGPGNYQLARIDARNHSDSDALGRVMAALAVEPDHLQARCLKMIILRRLDRTREADALQAATAALDPLDIWTRDLSEDSTEPGSAADAQATLDVALEYARVGEDAAALRLFDDAIKQDQHRPLGQTACTVLVHYHRAALLEAIGDPVAASAARAAARRADPTWNFPSRLDDVQVLQQAITAEPADFRAPALLGHWLYAQQRHDDAIACWQRAASLEGSDPVVWRNLAVAAFNRVGDTELAITRYSRALELAPADARLWYERDQLAKRVGEPIETRLARLEAVIGIVGARDDLCVEFAQLLIGAGRAEQALDVLNSRQFQPWEGGEGSVLRAWERARMHLSRQAILAGDPSAAIGHAEAAIEPPAGLGEARHPLANTAQLLLGLGDALNAAGKPTQARRAWTRAAQAVGDFQDMATHPYSENTFYAVLAARRLGEQAMADALITGLSDHVATLRQSPAVIDYFATSLPALLLFSDDPQDRRELMIAVLEAQLACLEAQPEEAAHRVEVILNRDPSQETALDLRHWLQAAAEDDTQAERQADRSAR